MGQFWRRGITLAVRMTHADKKKSKHEAERHYSDVRRLARQELESRPVSCSVCRLSFMNFLEDAQEADSWTANLPLGQRPGWSWEQEQRRFRVQRPRRFELALKVDSLLCGVALGRISDRHCRDLCALHLIKTKQPSSQGLRVRFDGAVRRISWCEVGMC